MYEEDFEAQLKEDILDIAKRCRNCNYCYSVCPLMESTRGFFVQGPAGIVQSIRYAILWNEIEGKYKEELRDILYLCTTCNSCVLRCKAKAPGIPVLDAIEMGRKLIVEKMIGPLPDQIKALTSLEEDGNPYGEPEKDRLKWLESFDNKEGFQINLLPNGDVDTLLYIGCTIPYHPEMWHILKTLVKVLEKLKLSFGILKEEKCCGSPARRMGEEGLFLDLMENNLSLFKDIAPKRIITISPHCFNTFKNEYSELANSINVQHYTQFFAELIDQGVLKISNHIKEKITYHDPCYLGKRNGVYEEPRKVILNLAGDNFIEMERNREDSLCCGGGGGRMWADVEEINRLSEIRVDEALKIGANIIVTACPWCHIQLTDGVKNKKASDKIKVMDLIELVGKSLLEE